MRGCPAIITTGSYIDSLARETERERERERERKKLSVTESSVLKGGYVPFMRETFDRA